ncbi:sensor histidine kinase [Blastococcus sp. URHD0036]|uniref:sensor histidine kinase n=1 Tax=Blastococcus sp. URHD0036 TaxID=1380356 RepID=UPI00068A025C|nr:sensor histidine kinase [Blastococcus sp. URHD0036]
MRATAEDGAAHAPSPARGWAGSAAGLGHAAVLYESPDVLLAATTPFIEEGLRAGDLVVLAATPELAKVITGPLGERAGSIESDTRICLQDTRVPDAFIALREALRRAEGRGSGRLRLIGQGLCDDIPGGAREWLRYEIAGSALLAGAPMSVLCALDTTVLGERLVAQAVAAHPQLSTADGTVDNRSFREPGSYLRSLPVPREPVEDLAPLLAVDGATVLAELRGRLRAGLGAAVPDADQREDLLLAVAEVMANAFRHGRPPVSARLWSDGRRLVCTVSDSGRGYDDPLAGLQPAHGEDLAHGGMGLWLARKLWDSVDLLSAGPGLTVRLSTELVRAPRS